MSSQFLPQRYLLPIICNCTESHCSSDNIESACSEGDQIWSLNQEDRLEKGMAGYPFHILAWRSPWKEDSGRLQSMGGHKESDMTEQLTQLLNLYKCMLIIQYLIILKEWNNSFAKSFQNKYFNLWRNTKTLFSKT